MPPEQVEHAVAEMEMMREFNRLIRPDSTTDPKNVAMVRHFQVGGLLLLAASRGCAPTRRR